MDTNKGGYEEVPHHHLSQISLLLSYASKGNVTEVKRLLDEGASINTPDYDGRTALHLAASEGHVPVVEQLLERGAFINPIDRWDDTPLADARKYNKSKVSKVLEMQGGVVEDNKKHGPRYEIDPYSQYEIDPSELEPVDHLPSLGKTATGEVRVMNWRGTKVAAKTVNKPLAADPELFNKFQSELVLLEQLRHPNIVQFLGAVTKSQPHVIVTEYLPRGDLHGILSKGCIDAKSAVGFALDIARGLNYLHEHKEPIVHRNLTPRNMLLNEAGQLKIAVLAFEVCKLLPGTSNSGVELYRTGEVGSYEYMAPEVYRKEAFDKSVDVFSFGLIVYEMFEGFENYEGLTPQTIAKKRAYEDMRPPFTIKAYPTGMDQLIQECWDKDPAKRPSFSEIIRRLEDVLPISEVGRCQCSIL